MIESTVRLVYGHLLAKQYGELEKITNGSRMSASEIEEAVSDYGCELTDYPDSIQLDVIEVEGGNPKEWSVVAPIFTKEEGLSDLSLELSITDNGQPVYEIEIDNIRVR